jgi:hypothetical protein
MVLNIVGLRHLFDSLLHHIYTYIYPYFYDLFTHFLDSYTLLNLKELLVFDFGHL